MCDRAAPTRRAAPRWRRLYVIAALAVVTLLALELVQSIALRSALEGVTTVATFVAMLGWVRKNGSAIDQLDWCDCAAATVTVRVIASGASSRAGHVPAARAAVTRRLRDPVEITGAR